MVTARLAAFGQEVFPGDLILTDREAASHNVASYSAKGIRPDVHLPEVREIRPGEQVDTPFTDVVLPVPGSRCTYPGHLPTQHLYDKVMQDNGFLRDDFSESGQSYLEGAYRHAVVVPRSLQARAVEYLEPCRRLVVSALDHVKGRYLEPGRVFDLQNDKAATALPDSRVGIVVELALHSGQYATVAMREFMQQSPGNELRSAG